MLSDYGLYVAVRQLDPWQIPALGKMDADGELVCFRHFVRNILNNRWDVWRRHRHQEVVRDVWRLGRMVLR